MVETFMPELRELYRYISLAAIAGVAGATLAFFAFRRKDFPLRPLSQLFGLLVSLVAVISLVVMLWDLSRAHVIVIGPQEITIGNEHHPVASLQDAHIERITETTMIGQHEFSEVGVLTFKDGRTWLFGEDRYDVKAIISRLREVMQSE